MFHELVGSMGTGPEKGILTRNDPVEPLRGRPVVVDQGFVEGTDAVRHRRAGTAIVGDRAPD
ncbi:hypothetical protein [Nakamurella endophytica]|uniref:Uncharacterized protein n=1 Tax=Nakamurella endophytica TaxID=1748367 RepID=A0A917SN86_9ACTN|nr:hypothetical protein [Nakamurella endophytica]GGL88143.1 hypothetical protein GCM10011594_04680 [Nakamurella endophytica]